MRRTMMLEALVLTSLLAGGRAEDPPGDAQIRAYLAAQAEKLEASFLPGVASAADFEGIRPRLREEYFYMLGLWPLPEKTPLHATVTGILERGDCAVEKLHFQSRERLYVTGNLYRPREAGGKRLPAVLYVCGHSSEGRNGNKTSFQDHGIWFAKHGYVCLVIDTLQLGEIAALHHGTYREGRWWWHSAGYTPAGVECWNGVRAIDYLVSRADVDPERIAATGISGGGAATFWIAAADERVRAALPVSGMADLTSYVSHEVVNGHCDCMFLYNTFRWNWTSIAALVCPRLLLFMNSDNDSIFPMDANERVIARLERLYGRFGAGDRVDAVVSIGGHAYRRDLRQAAFRFLNTHLKGDSRPVDDPEIGLSAGDPKTPLIPREELRVFPAESDIPADQINTRIDELFVPRASPALPEPGQHSAWREKLLAELSRVCFGAWPEEAVRERAVAGAPQQRGLFASEPGISVWWPSIPSPIPEGEPAVWIIVLNPGDPMHELPGWAPAVTGGGPAVLLATRGVGRTRWTRKNPPNTYERSLALIGQTADGGRVYDVLVAARRIKSVLGAKTVKLAGRGPAGVIAAYAAAYAPEVAEVVAIDSPSSHAPTREGAAIGPAILNVLRVLDVPDAFGLLAPRRVTLIGADKAAFRKTAEIYDRAGASGALDIR